MRKYGKIIYGLAGLCVVAVGLFYVMRNSGGSTGVAAEAAAAELNGGSDFVNISGADDGTEGGTAVGIADVTSGECETGNKAYRLCVYVCGAVAKPGIYFFEDGARMAEAVFAAGGMLPDADAVYLNLASKIADGQKIYVPFIGESLAAKESAGTVSEESGGPGGLININTADAALLSGLPGIGRAKAEAVVAYREANGRFKSTDEIMNVPGIKDASYAKIKDLICV